MCDWKMWGSSAIFVLVTIGKLLFPQETADIRQEVVALIDMDMDYGAAIQQVGAMLFELPVQQVMAEEEGSLPQATEEPSTSPVVNVIIPATEAEEQNEKTDVLSKIEDYIRSQEAYANYVMPANVSYTSLYLPFAYTSPVNGVCASGFGYRVHPIEGEVLFHYGTDYDVTEGTEIGCFGDGVVYAVGTESGYGNYIIVSHEDGWETLYAHCSQVLVTSGQTVKMGETIALSGQTGRVTGPHLHFELKHHDLYTNPEFFLA